MPVVPQASSVQSLTTRSRLSNKFHEDLNISTHWGPGEMVPYGQRLFKKNCLKSKLINFDSNFEHATSHYLKQRWPWKCVIGLPWISSQSLWIPECEWSVRLVSSVAVSGALTTHHVGQYEGVGQTAGLHKSAELVLVPGTTCGLVTKRAVPPDAPHTIFHCAHKVLKRHKSKSIVTIDNSSACGEEGTVANWEGEAIVLSLKP